jgi:hypothetical protein
MTASRKKAKHTETWCMRFWSVDDIPKCLSDQRGRELMDELMEFMDEHGCDLRHALRVLLATGLSTCTHGVLAAST